jgi:hypothetical protein
VVVNTIIFVPSLTFTRCRFKGGSFYALRGRINTLLDILSEHFL